MHPVVFWKRNDSFYESETSRMRIILIFQSTYFGKCFFVGVIADGFTNCGATEESAPHSE